MFRHLLLALCFTLILPFAQAAPGDLEKMIELQRQELRSNQEKIDAMEKKGRQGAKGKELNLDDAEREKLSRVYDTQAYTRLVLEGYVAALLPVEQARRSGVDDGLLHLTAALIHMHAAQWSKAASSLDEAEDRFLSDMLKAPTDRADVWNQFYERHLRRRAEWSEKQTYLALAQGRSSDAVRWSETICHYVRMMHIHHQIAKDSSASSRKTLMHFDAAIQSGAKLPGDYAELPCLDGDGYDGLYVMLSRASAGQSPRDFDWKARYPASEPLYLRLAELFIDGKPLSDADMEKLTHDAMPELADYLDRLCEGHYFSGMYYRYLKKDLAEARRQFNAALGTGSLTSTEYFLARFELERLPAALAEVASADAR